MDETARRREVQRRFNEEHGITPKTVQKRISSLQESIWEQDYVTVPVPAKSEEMEVPSHELPELIESLRREMKSAADELDFERAADLRDRIQGLEAQRLQLS